MTVRPWPRFASPLPRNRARRRPPVRLVRLVFGKIRLALFEKRPHAFNAILGFQSHLLRAAFGTQLFLQGIVGSRGMQGANLPENSAGTCGEAMRYGLRAPEKFAGGNHGIDQAPFERGL